MDEALRTRWAAVFGSEPEHLRYELRVMVSNFDELRVRVVDATSGLLDAPDADLADGCRELIKAVENLDQEVRDKWVRLQNQARQGPVTTTVPRLDVFAADWLRDVVKPSLALSTVANYELFTRLYIVPDLGKKRLDRLTVRDVRLWINELKVRCQGCFQGKDLVRATPRCCAAGNCCRQVASEWTCTRRGRCFGACWARRCAMSL